MGLEQGRMSGSQLANLVIGFTIGSALVLMPGQAAKQDAWIAILIGLAEGLAFALIYLALAQRFPGRTLVEISQAVYGHFLGTAISAAFLWFLFHLGSLVLRNFSDYFTITSMPKTPPMAFLALIVWVCIWVTRNGIEVLARCSEVLVPLLLATVALTVALMIPEMDLRNLQPVLATPPGQLLWAAHRSATFPFAETVAFLMVIPFLNNARRAKGAVVRALIIAGLTLALAAARNTAVLGATGAISTYPSYTAVQQIDVLDVITRLEILVDTSLLTMGFIKVAVLLYGTTLGTAQLLGLRSYRPLATPIGTLMAILAILNFDNVAENIAFADLVWPLYALPFQLGIPLLTLVVAMVRGLPRKEA